MMCDLVILPVTFFTFTCNIQAILAMESTVQQSYNVYIYIYIDSIFIDTCERIVLHKQLMHIISVCYRLLWFNMCQYIASGPMLISPCMVLLVFLWYSYVWLYPSPNEKRDHDCDNWWIECTSDYLYLGSGTMHSLYVLLSIVVK